MLSPRPVITITPAHPGARRYASDLWHHRDLINVLAGRDVRLRYRQTALGAVWVLLQPLLGAGVLSFVFGKIAKLPTEGVPAFVFAFCGMLCWTLFSATLSRTAGSLVSHGSMLQKVFFPRLVLPLSTVYASLIDFAVAFCVAIVLMAMNGIGIGLRILVLPLAMGAALALSIGIGCIVASGMVRFRDVGQVTPVVVQLLLYLSPVAYSASVVPEKWKTLYYLNPIAPIIELFRWSLLGTRAPSTGHALYGCAVSVAVLALGTIVLTRSERKFADVI